MGVVAVIPARGGSKRIPKKNLVNFMGRPLIEWTIRAAKECTIFDDIFVSTDDEDIAKVAKNNGINVPVLRDKFYDDESTVSTAIIHALNQFSHCSGKKHEHVVQLMPTCPLRTADNIIDAWTYFKSGMHDFQISTFKFGWNNPWWAARLDKNGVPSRLFEGTQHIRSQDLDDLYCPSGAIWIANIQKLKAEGTFYGRRHVFHEINWKNAVDIDTYDDLDFAEAVHIIVNSKSNNKSNEEIPSKNIT